jgi:hypothetical protein
MGVQPVKRTTVPKSVISKLHSYKQRHALTESIIRLVESLRDSYLPGIRTWDAFALLLILHRIDDMHAVGRAASASALAWSTGMPRTTVKRKLARLKKMGAVEQRGSRFFISPAHLNAPDGLQGFARQREIVRHLSKKLTETASRGIEVH